MDEGLIQILVIAFFIIVSMMDAAARKKRQQRGRGGETNEDRSPDTLRHIPSRAEPTSEDMVPDELWEEIAALARGERPPSREGRTEAPVPLEPHRTGTPEFEETSLGPAHQHVEEHDHVEWGDASGSGESMELEPDAREDGSVAPARAATPTAGSVRRGLALRRQANLRRAVILAEVLGPPAAQRGAVHEPPA